MVDCLKKLSNEIEFIVTGVFRVKSNKLRKNEDWETHRHLIDRGAESSSCAPARGGGFFENCHTGEILEKSIRRGNVVLFIINYRI
jgi:hypothetical protein